MSAFRYTITLAPYTYVRTLMSAFRYTITLAPYTYVHVMIIGICCNLLCSKFILSLIIVPIIAQKILMLASYYIKSALPW